MNMAPIDKAKDAQQMLGFVTFISVIIGVIGFFFDLERKGQQADDMAPLSNENNMGYFASKKPSRWEYTFLWKQTVPRFIPTAEYLVQMGDDLLYTSSVFDQMQTPHFPKLVSWVPIYAQIFDTIAYRSLRKEIEVELSPTADLVLEKAKSRVFSLAESGSIRKLDYLMRQQLYQGEHPDLINCVRYFKGFHSRFSPKRGPDYSASDGGKFHNDEMYSVSDSSESAEWEKGKSTYTFVSAGKPCTSISREEFSALALIFGINLRVCDKAPNTIAGVGAFGVSLAVRQNPDVHWEVRFVQAARRLSHHPSRGSGYSTLFAKHMACGNIPFTRGSDDTHLDYIKSVCIPDEKSLRSLKRGANFVDSEKSVTLPAATEYMTRLPFSRCTGLWPHFLDETSEVSSAVQYAEHLEGHGLIKKAKGRQKTGTWWEAVAGIAFGGLVPQTTKEIRDAVKFTTSRLSCVFKFPFPEAEDCDKSPEADGCDSWLNELEMLINAIHGEANDLNLFGNAVAQRTVSATDIDFTFKCEDTRDAAALFGRYMTLLERLMATCIEQEPMSDLESVYAKVSDNLRRSYLCAVYWESHSSPEDYEVLLQQLACTIKTIRESYKNSGSVTSDDVARIACCILAAWSQNVQLIKVRVRKDKGDSDENVTYMEDLPPLLALA